MSDVVSTSDAPATTAQPPATTAQTPATTAQTPATATSAPANVDKPPANTCVHDCTCLYDSDDVHQTIMANACMDAYLVTLRELTDGAVVSPPTPRVIVLAQIADTVVGALMTRGYQRVYVCGGIQPAGGATNVDPHEVSTRVFRWYHPYVPLTMNMAGGHLLYMIAFGSLYHDQLKTRTGDFAVPRELRHCVAITRAIADQVSPAATVQRIRDDVFDYEGAIGHLTTGGLAAMYERTQAATELCRLFMRNIDDSAPTVIIPRTRYDAEIIAICEKHSYELVFTV